MKLKFGMRLKFGRYIKNLINFNRVENINQSAAFVSLMTLFCRFLGFARDTVIAKYLGAGDVADSFFASFKLSNLFRKIFGEGALFSGFVPVFTKINNQSKVDAVVFSSRVFTIISITLLVIVGFGEFFMDYIVKAISPGFSGKKFEDTVKIARITFPYFYFITSCSVLWGVLNSIGVFFYYGFVPAILSIVMIFFALVFKNNFNDISMCLSYSVLCGGFLQFVTSYLGCIANKYSVKFTKPVFDINVRAVFSKMLNTTISTSLTQINTIIDGVLASFIPSAVSYLYYADRIFYFPFSIVGITLSIVSLPAISKAISTKDHDRVKDLQSLAIKLVILYGLPFSIGIFFLSNSMSYTIFQYGDFLSKDTLAVAKITSIFGLGLFFALVGRVMTVIFFANGDTKTPMKITIFGVLINIAISIALLKPFGVYGIACGTATSYFITAIITCFIAKKNNMLFLDKSLNLFFTKTFLVCVLLGLICFVFNKYFTMISGGFFVRILTIILFGAFCGGLYLTLLYLLKINLWKITFAKNQH
jgi:putative peptidoglycan lipid II flippase